MTLRPARLRAHWSPAINAGQVGGAEVTRSDSTSVTTRSPGLGVVCPWPPPSLPSQHADPPGCGWPRPNQRRWPAACRPSTAAVHQQAQRRTWAHNGPAGAPSTAPVAGARRASMLASDPSRRRRGCTAATPACPRPSAARAQRARSNNGGQLAGQFTQAAVSGARQVGPATGSRQGRRASRRPPHSSSSPTSGEICSSRLQASSRGRRPLVLGASASASSPSFTSGRWCPRRDRAFPTTVAFATAVRRGEHLPTVR